jgi:hypothetical protein
VILGFVDLEEGLYLSGLQLEVVVEFFELLFSHHGFLDRDTLTNSSMKPANF